MTRAELFAQAAANRKAAKAEEEQLKKNSGGYDTHFTALEENTPKAFRIVGLPYSMRGDDRFSPKLINYSQILGDDGKKFRCIWPIKNENSNWILWRIFNKVMSGKWNNEEQVKIFDYKEKFPSIWRRVAKNDKIENKFEKGWRPSPMVIMNVIDRGAMQWHSENKKYSILSKKVSDNNGTPWYEPGIPQMLYNLIYDTIVAIYNDWETYDIVALKMTEDPWYQVWQGVDDYKKFSTLYPNFAFDKGLADRPLTEEELSWEKYDLDKMNPVTSYQKINNRLKIFIQQVDEAFKTKFYPELLELVEKEKAEFIKKNIKEADEDAEEKAEEEAKPAPKPEEKKVVSPSVATPAPKTEAKATTAPAPARTVRTAAVSTDHLKKLEKSYPFVAKLTDAEKTFLVGYDEVKDVPVWKDVQLFQCPSCKTLAPGEVNTCIKCGIEFGEGSAS